MFSCVSAQCLLNLFSCKMHWNSNEQFHWIAYDPSYSSRSCPQANLNHSYQLAHANSSNLQSLPQVSSLHFSVAHLRFPKLTAQQNMCNIQIHNPAVTGRKFLIFFFFHFIGKRQEKPGWTPGKILVIRQTNPKIKCKQCQGQAYQRRTAILEIKKKPQ